MAVTKEIIEIKDGPERQKQMEELFSKGFAVVQETPDKVVMMKFTPNTRIKMTKESLTVALYGIQQEVLEVCNKLHIIERPSKEKDTFYTFKMTVSHTDYGWEKNNVTHEELDVPYHLNQKILELVKEFYLERKKELNKQRDEFIERYVKDTKEEQPTQKRKICPTCKHKQQCIENAKKSGIILLGDTCMRYEESTEEEPND